MSLSCLCVPCEGGEVRQGGGGNELMGGLGCSREGAESWADREDCLLGYDLAPADLCS